MAYSDNRTALGATCLVAGTVVGAGLALLFAPQSGKETRDDITWHAKRATRKADRMIDDFAGNVSDMVDTVGEKADKILDKGKSLAHGTKKGILSVLESGRDKLEGQRARLARLVA